MFFSALVNFFNSKRNILSVFITLFLIVAFYTFFLEIATPQQQYVLFFETLYVNLPTLLFYLISFNYILSEGVVRFYKINLDQNVFNRSIYSGLVVSWLVISTLVGLLFFTVYYPQSNLSFNASLLKFLFFVYYQLFQCIFCFTILSIIRSIWTPFVVVFYIMSESTIIALLKSSGLNILAKFLPFQLFRDLIDFKYSEYSFVTLIYLLMLFSITYKFNYKKT